MDQVKLVDLVGQWLALDKHLLQFCTGSMPFGWSTGDLLFIECRICWCNMGWVGGDRVFSNSATFEASDPNFFKKLRASLIKHTKKCHLQKY